MPEEHKVPKGVFDSASMMYGLTIEQFFILSALSVFLTLGTFIIKKYTLQFLLASGVFIGILYFVFKISNYYAKNAFQEYLKYTLITRIKFPPRYSGRTKDRW